MDAVQKARAIMAEFPASPYQKGLMAVTDLVTARDQDTILVAIAGISTSFFVPMNSFKSASTRV